MEHKMMPDLDEEEATDHESCLSLSSRLWELEDEDSLFDDQDHSVACHSHQDAESSTSAPLEVNQLILHLLIFCAACSWMRALFWMRRLHASTFFRTHKGRNGAAEEDIS